MDFLRKVTPLQWLGVIILFNGVIIGGGAQLNDLVGANITHKLISVAGLGNMFLGGLVTMFSGQGAQIRNVAAMPGVETITVNKLANATLATIAVDPAMDKVEATPQAQAAVAATAKGAA